VIEVQGRLGSGTEVLIVNGDVGRLWVPLAVPLNAEDPSGPAPADRVAGGRATVKSEKLRESEA